MVINKVRYEAEKARKVFEKYSCDIRETYFGAFPTGSCGNASDFLAQWLKTLNVAGIEYVSGRRRKETHAWLEIGKYIIDITSDQFADGYTPVYVSEKHDFYNTFTEQTRSKPSISPYMSYELKIFKKYMQDN